jgi:signal transduction histidine kinase
MKREIKLIILVFLLVVGPAVLLSLFAGRVLNSWQIVIQKRLETDAVRVLRMGVAAWEAEINALSSRTSVHDSYILGSFIFAPGVGLTYPPPESTGSSFIPPSVVSEPSARAAGLLQKAAVLRASGATNLAVECLRKVAGMEGEGGVKGLRGSGGDVARDPDEGFYYDLIALKLLGDREEARRRVLARYDDLVPLQRDLMVEWIEEKGVQGLRDSGIQRQESGFIIHHSSFIISSQWRERMRGRELTAGDRENLAREIGGLVPSLPESGWIKARIGAQEALVGREEGVKGLRGSGERGIIVLQFDEAKLREHLNELFAGVATNSGIAVRIEDRESSAFHPSSLILHTSMLPAPLEFITLVATPSDPRAFIANARLQKRLYGWGGGLLIISVVAGAGLIWRQAAGEIRDARERTDFAATVSHDLRTPLSSMRMLAESLYMGNIVDDAKKKTFLGAIVKESDRLSRLTDRALYFIRYGQGSLRYQFTEGDLGSLVKDVVETFAIGIGAKVETSVNGSSVIRLALDPELPQVRFDDGAMEQVVFNLLDNAVKYSSPENGVRLEVSLTARPNRPALFHWGTKAATSEVVLSVKDNGVGMTLDEVRQILKPYARGRGAAKQNKRGIGLGLALCHHVVKAHGGRIEIKSEPGRGTTFFVIFPAVA